MALLPEHRRRLIASSKEQAAALLDDMNYLQSVVAKENHTAAEIRRDSAILRRLLIERDIVIVAAPRVGKFTLRAPNNQRFYKANESVPFTFFSNSNVSVFGSHLAVALVDLKKGDRADFAVHRSELINSPVPTISLSVERFLSQQVLCMRGRWVNRGDVIKYIANIASGVHSGTPKTPQDDLISEMRRSVIYSTDGNATSVTFKADLWLIADEPEFAYRPDTVDPILVELLGMIKRMSESPDFMRLKAVIEKELATG